VPDQQQSCIGAQRSRELERLAGVEAGCQRLVTAQQVAGLAPLRDDDLGRLSRARLRAERDRLDLHVQPSERGAGRSRLGASAVGQTSLGVRARPVRLGLGVT